MCLRPFVIGVALVVAFVDSSAWAQQTQHQSHHARLKADLGRNLFFDRRMSADASTACGDCHQPERGWTDGRKTAQGMAQRFIGPRNTPTVLGAAAKQLQFLDGRAESLRQQTTLPLVNPIEMGNQSQQEVVDRLNSIDGYRDLFTAAFGELATQDHIAECLETFVGTLTSKNAAIDHFLDGKSDALTPAAQRGYAIFTKYCSSCHQPPFYRDDKAHNTGIAFRFSTEDEGRFKVDGSTQNNIRAFMTPTLREVVATAPYTHHGDIETLEEMVAHYARGGARKSGKRDEFIDPRVAQISLGEQEQTDLVAFLREAFKGEYPHIEPPEDFPQ